MQQMPPTRRSRDGGRQQPGRAVPQKRKRRKSRKGVIFALILTLAAAALLVIVSPKEPLSRAAYSAASTDGTTDTVAAVHDPKYNGLVISEMMTSNRAAVPDDNGEYHDWVEVWNSSDSAIDLGGVGLSDRSDSIRFLFPSVTLAADGRVVVYCSDTNQAEAGKDFHAKFKLSSVGETVYLYDPGAYLIDSAAAPIMSSDESWARADDGSFAATTDYSPGYPNTPEGHSAYEASTMVTDGAVIINEVMADGKSGLSDGDGEFSDWIELYNTTDQTVDLSRYYLSGKENKPLEWRFPDGATIGPKSYYVVFCSGKDRVDAATGVPHTNFRISAEHDTVLLSDSRGRLMDKVIIDNLAEDCSYGRNESGIFTVFQLATPGLPNNQLGANQMDYNMRQMNSTGVYISEVMASNDSTVVYQDGSFVDWVELYNSSQTTVDLSGYGLSDNIGRARKWQFPQGTFISPGEYKVILCDGQTALSTTSQLHAGFKVQRMGGETICLADPTGRVLDKLVLPMIPTNVSYGRTIGLLGFFYYDAPTPMAANGTGFAGYAAAPSFTVAPGLYYATVYAAFNVPEGTTVFYTTDGSIPTQSSTAYHGETLKLNFTTVVRARAFSDMGLEPSEVLTGTYFINAYHSLPIVSLVADPDVLWNSTDGMLTVGPNVDKTVFPFKNTIYREFGKVTREGHIEYYLLDGTQVLDQGMGFELSGAYSLDMPQKSFKLRAKSLYGQKTFTAALFADRDYTEYKGIVLRNSGNDCVWTRLQDGFQSKLMDAYGTTVIHQSWNPVVVYLNGVYWGHYNMRERVDRFFVAQHEGLSLEDADKMDIVEANSKTKYGSNKEYKEMLKKIKTLSPGTNPDDLQYILDNVDVDNYFEYIALEMFFGNSDPGNIRYYKLQQPGAKWKWIIYDLDYGLYNSTFDSPASYLKESGMGQQKIDNTILRKLLENTEYKDKFLRKLGDIYQTFTTEFMLSVLEPLVDIIEPEMQLHWARWGEENDPAIIAEAPTTADGALRYWRQRVERLRNVVKKRPNLLWGYVQDAFNLSNDKMLDYFGPRPEMPADAV